MSGLCETPPQLGNILTPSSPLSTELRPRGAEMAPLCLYRSSLSPLTPTQTHLAVPTVKLSVRFHPPPPPPPPPPKRAGRGGWWWGVRGVGNQFLRACNLGEGLLRQGWRRRLLSQRASECVCGRTGQAGTKQQLCQ